MTFKIEGLRELEAKLMLLKPATGKAALRRAGNKAMQPMADLAKRFAPELTGELSGSIKTGARAQGAGAQIGKSEYAAVMRAGGSRSEASAALRAARRTAKASSNAASVELFMGPTKAKTKKDAIKRIAQEFGTRKMAAQPYMRPAWDMDKEAMLARVVREMRIEIDKTLVRAARRGALRG